ncbi:MAG: SUMF1/EgtB/PvdO family nonheme iron enzyme [Anaerolineae bacterium]|nr:SUMF1/EgtB/PvdO family nonheme iron enzyme [Anaerolineae bacterium]
MARIFISYSRADRQFLDQFLPLLHKAFKQHSVWHDADIGGGKHWWNVILSEVGKCDLFVYLISNESLESEYCRAEMREALRLNKPILPIIARRLSPAYPGRAADNLKQTLIETQYLDFSGGFRDAALLTAELVGSITDLFEQVPSQSATPNDPRPTPEPSVRDKKSWWQRLTEAQGLVIAALIGLVGIIGAALITRATSPTSNTPIPTTLLPTIDPRVALILTQTLEAATQTAAVTPIISPTTTSTLTSTLTETPVDPLDFANQTFAARTDQVVTRIAAYTKTPTSMQTLTPDYQKTGEAIVAATDTRSTLNANTANALIPTLIVSAATDYQQMIITDNPTTPTRWPTSTPTAQWRLANGGVGLTNGARMDNGVFQVEGYCMRLGLSIARNDSYWYCGAKRLGQVDFTQICRLTYKNNKAFARQDGSDSQPAFRWRCYIQSDAATLTPYPTLNEIQNPTTWKPIIRTFEYEGYGVEMVLVPAGSFMMGDGNKNPQQIEQPFWIDRYEVTNEQFDALNGNAANESRWTEKKRPRETIAWEEANAFCIQKRSGFLPTETQWEWSARGPQSLKYPWGNIWDPSITVWFRSVALGTANVGSEPKGKSWVGALDMSGNVWEWTSSIDEAYLSNVDSLNHHVLKGNSWSVRNAVYLRAAYRSIELPNPSDKQSPFSNIPFSLKGTIGFRCARSIDTEN